MVQIPLDLVHESNVDLPVADEKSPNSTLVGVARVPRRVASGCANVSALVAIQCREAAARGVRTRRRTRLGTTHSRVARASARRRRQQQSGAVGARVVRASAREAGAQALRTGVRRACAVCAVGPSTSAAHSRRASRVRRCSRRAARLSCRTRRSRRAMRTSCAFAPLRASLRVLREVRLLLLLERMVWARHSRHTLAVAMRWSWTMRSRCVRRTSRSCKWCCSPRGSPTYRRFSTDSTSSCEPTRPPALAPMNRVSLFSRNFYKFTCSKLTLYSYSSNPLLRQFTLQFYTISERTSLSNMCYCYLLKNLMLCTAGEVHRRSEHALRQSGVHSVSNAGAFPRDYRVHSVAGCIRRSGGRESVRHSLCSVEFGRDRWAQCWRSSSSRSGSCSCGGARRVLKSRVHVECRRAGRVTRDAAAAVIDEALAGRLEHEERHRCRAEGATGQHQQQTATAGGRVSAVFCDVVMCEELVQSAGGGRRHWARAGDHCEPPVLCGALACVRSAARRERCALPPPEAAAFARPPHRHVFHLSPPPESAAEYASVARATGARVSRVPRGALALHTARFARVRRERVWAFGPHRCGPNLLVNNVPLYRDSRPSIWESLSDASAAVLICTPAATREFDASVVNGFDLACNSVPLCGEPPLVGVCFLVDEWRCFEEAEQTSIVSCGDGQQPTPESLATVTESNETIPCESGACRALSKTALSASSTESLAGALISATRDACALALTSCRVRRCAHRACWRPCTRAACFRRPTVSDACTTCWIDARRALSARTCRAHCSPTAVRHWGTRTLRQSRWLAARCMWWTRCCRSPRVSASRTNCGSTRTASRVPYCSSVAGLYASRTFITVFYRWSISFYSVHNYCMY